MAGRVKSVRNACYIANMAMQINRSVISRHTQLDPSLPDVTNPPPSPDPPAFTYWCRPSPPSRLEPAEIGCQWKGGEEKGGEREREK